jgi:hypothetical protein
LARRHRRAARLALRLPARSPGAPATRSSPNAPGGLAADRVARGREVADQYELSTLPENIEFAALVAKLRWRIERDYQLKQEVGLGHFEGPGWRGFHHHATMCIAIVAPCLRERLLSPRMLGIRVLQSPLATKATHLSQHRADLLTRIWSPANSGRASGPS